MIKTFSGQIGSREVLSTTPIWTVNDIGRFIYSEADNKAYFGNATGWVEIGSGSGPSSLAPYASLDPSNFILDSTDVGSDFGTGFSGLVSSVDYSPIIKGTAWSHFNFKDSGFDDTKDITFDLHWIANGVSGSTLISRIIVNIWVVDTGGSPSVLMPTATQTVDISIAVADTGKKKANLAFLVLSNLLIPATTETIFASVTREADHNNDTYTGTFQVINLVGRQ